MRSPAPSSHVMSAAVVGWPVASAIPDGADVERVDRQAPLRAARGPRARRPAPPWRAIAPASMHGCSAPAVVAASTRVSNSRLRLAGPSGCGRGPMTAGHERRLARLDELLGARRARSATARSSRGPNPRPATARPAGCARRRGAMRRAPARAPAVRRPRESARGPGGRGRARSAAPGGCDDVREWPRGDRAGRPSSCRSRPSRRETRRSSMAPGRRRSNDATSARARIQPRRARSCSLSGSTPTTRSLCCAALAAERPELDGRRSASSRAPPSSIARPSPTSGRSASRTWTSRKNVYDQ